MARAGATVRQGGSGVRQRAPQPTEESLLRWNSAVWAGWRARCGKGARATRTYPGKFRFPHFGIPSPAAAVYGRSGSGGQRRQPERVEKNCRLCGEKSRGVTVAA